VSFVQHYHIVAWATYGNVLSKFMEFLTIALSDKCSTFVPKCENVRSYKVYI